MNAVRPVLEVKDLEKQFIVAGRRLRAVRDVSFALYPAESIGLVGESGSGKTTIARLIMKLLQPTAGHVYFDDVDVHLAAGAELQGIRRQLQMVFQDPTKSLNPRLRARRALYEQLAGTSVRGTAAWRRVDECAAQVGLEPRHLSSFPYQLSGGQKQRVSIARALMTNPRCLVLDEPTSALDMTVKKAILDMLVRLRRDLGMVYLLITHDLSTVRYFCQRVVVIYLGKVVETGPVAEVFSRPVHPYTQALISAIPSPDPRQRKTERLLLQGETPSLLNPAPGCPFRTRCPYVVEECRINDPPLQEVGSGREVACHRVRDFVPSFSGALVEQP